ncbi:MAG: amidohydrolase, partial [Flavobacteriaceae bacterium]|nr:amidohydrolase [Flavobacteriaceae bacterium]
MKTNTFTLICLLLSTSLTAQRREVDESLRMDFEEYNPTSTLKVPENPVTRAAFPFIDVHNHQFRMPDMNLTDLITEMDKLNMAVMVNLSGRGRNSSDHLARGLENVKENYPNRFIVFTNINLSTIDEEGWSEKTAKQIEEDYNLGARGLKIYKSQGMTSTDSKGKRIPIDDPRIDPVWTKCGELG